MRFLYLLIITSLLTSIAAAQEPAEQQYAITFKGLKTKLTKQTRATLDSFAVVLKAKPDLNGAITSYCTSENTKFNIASWDRLHHLLDYLIEKHGIVYDRFILKYGSDHADCNELTLTLTTEKPEPIKEHPSLRKRNQ